MSNTFAGSPLFIDLHGAKRLDDAKSTERALKHAVESLGLKLNNVRLDRIAGGGFAGVAALATGQFSLRACSRSGFAAIDAQGCAGLKPEAALIALANAFEAREAVIRKARRSATIALPTLRLAPKAARSTVVRSKAQAKAA